MGESYNAILMHEGDVIVAQCVELDVAAQGADEAEAMDRLALTLAAQMIFDSEPSDIPVIPCPKTPESVLHRMAADPGFIGYTAFKPAELTRLVERSRDHA